MASENSAEQSSRTKNQDRVSVRLVLRIMILVLAMAAALWLIYHLKRVLLLLVLSIFFSFLIAPLVNRFEQTVNLGGRPLKLSRAAAIGAIYLLLLLVIVIIAYGLLPDLAAQVSAFATHLPEYAIKARSYFERLELLYKNQSIPPEWRRAISLGASRISQNLFDSTGAGLLRILGLATFLPWLILVPILSFFMLKDAEFFRDTIISAFPTRRLRRRIDVLFSDVSQALAAYVRAQLLACLLVGIICTIGFKLLGSPYPLVLGVGAGVFEFIPLAGPLLTAIIAFFVSATVSFKLALSVLIFLLAFRIVEDYIIYPRLVGHGMEMHPLAIVVAVLCGAELGGIIGIFLAIPVLALLTVFYRNWLEHRGSKGIVADLFEPSVETPSQPSPSPKQAECTADSLPKIEVKG
jgi:predicted PurR-regulated permease PerM